METLNKCIIYDLKILVGNTGVVTCIVCVHVCVCTLHILQVTPSSHRYFKEIEMREEGGTPAIIGSIRAGLAMQLKEAVGCEEIMALEEKLVRRVLSKWKDIPEVCTLYTSKLKIL